jgi:serine/threonine-protein kinase
MMDAQRRVKLADFGVARIQDSDRSMAGTMVGTPAFMSPEQIKGEKVDGRTDIFSAGTILYQLLTGEQPFKGEGAWTVAKRIVEEDPPPPSRLAVSVSPALDAVVHKALAKEPAQRYGKAREFAAALRGALGKVPPAATPPAAKPKNDSRATEAEVEFWRSIQNSTDAAELESYLQEFPQGTYAQLARIKVAKLREPIEAARKAAEEKEKQEAAAKAQREAEEKAREAAAKAKRDAEEKARREAAAKAMRESEEKIRQAQALAKLKQQQDASRRAKPAIDEDATVAQGNRQSAAPPPSVERSRSYTMPVVAAAILIAAAIGAYGVLSRKPTPPPVAEAPVQAPAPAPAHAAPPKPEITAADVEKIKKETEERIRREYADKSAAEQAAAVKAASEKAIQEKQLTLKAAAEKAAAEKAGAEKLAAEKAQAEKMAAAKSATERAALEKAAAEKIAAEKAEAERQAAEKAAAEKAASDKAAAAKATAAAKPGWPNVGDRWVYEARDLDQAWKNYQIAVQVLSVSPTSIRDMTRVSASGMEHSHQAGAMLIGIAQGVASFSPYLRAFQELRVGERWSNIEQKQLWDCASTVTCSASAHVVGMEKVSVKAGTYDAWKVAVELHVRGAQRPGVAALTFWYAEGPKRIVKYQFRQNIQLYNTGGYWTQPNMDVELVSYTPAAAK